MNVFNRLLIILLALLLLVAAGAVLLTTLRVIQPAQLAPTPWFVDRLVPFTQLGPTSWSWVVGVSVVLLLVGLLLLFLELRPGPREAPRFKWSAIVAWVEDGAIEIPMARGYALRQTLDKETPIDTILLEPERIKRPSRKSK